MVLHGQHRDAVPHSSRLQSLTVTELVMGPMGAVLLDLHKLHCTSSKETLRGEQGPLAEGGGWDAGSTSQAQDAWLLRSCSKHSHSHDTPHAADSVLLTS